MVSGIISFLFGILTLQQFSTLPAIYWCWGLIFILFLPLLTCYWQQLRIFILLILFILGFLWALLRAHWVLDVGLPAGLQGKDLLVSGVVASIPLKDEIKQRFEFDIETLVYEQKKLASPGRVRLSWYAKSRNAKSARETVKAGQRWQFWVRLKQPHGFMNPAGFDYEGWLYQNKIRATGYIRLNAKNNLFAKKLANDANKYHLLSFRQYLHDTLLSFTSENKYSGILVALAMGERTGITQDQWQVFRATGTSHLVAISGLHIGLLAGFVFFLIRRLWPYCGSAALVLASPRAAAICALIIAGLYAALSGFAIPAQRALVMLFIIMFSVFIRHKVQSSKVLALALLSVLLLDPVVVLSAGFWLSFTAVAIISYAALGRLSLDKSWKSWGRVQWRISLVLIPLLVFLFQQASFVSPLANLFAIPMVSFFIVPLVLLGTAIVLFLPDLAMFMFSIADTLLAAMWWVLSHLADMPVSQWQGVKPSLVTFILATIGFLLLLTPKRWPAKSIGVFLILPLFWPNTPLPDEGEVEVTLLDVGQGLSAVLQTKRHVLLFDTGAKFSESFDTGAAVVVPFLRQKNINRINILILSHRDNDHRGGFESVKSEIKTDSVLSSYNESGTEKCRAGQSWFWDGVMLEMLNPAEFISNKKRNNASCVLRVSAGNQSLLMTADIEKRAEKQLIKYRYKQLKSTYLIAPHHGSKTSSSREFLEAVNPEYIFIPVGFKNRYRMPHATVLQRYDKMNIPYLQSYKSGAISVRFGQKSSSQVPVEYRKLQQKYWNSRH